MKTITTMIITSLLCCLMVSIFEPHMLASSGSVIDDTRLTTSPFRELGPAWSPDGQKIIYTSYDAGGWNRHIWIMNADGSNRQQLTFGNVVTGQASFSPDGSKIYFAQWGLRGDTNDLMVMNVDGTNVTRLTYGPDGVVFNSPQVSPDGTKITFTLYYGTTANDHDYRVCLMDTDKIVHGFEDFQIITIGADSIWVNNGEEILYTCDPTNIHWSGLLRIMNKDGTNIRQLTEGPYDAHPSMSPDSRKIVFSRSSFWPPQAKWDIYIVDSDGSNLERLTFDLMGNIEPSFNPQINDGIYEIVYSSFKSGNGDIWVMRVGAPTISATIDLNPDTLNLRSRGKWITCYIELLERYGVADINVSTIMLNDTVSAELEPTDIGDYDNDIIPDLMVKFDRAKVIQYILNSVDTEEKFMKVTLTITGKLNDETPFEGSDKIKIIYPPPIQGKFIQNI